MIEAVSHNSRRTIIMLEVELDIFSGMPNPVWILSEREERELYDRLTAEPSQVSPAYAADEQFSLGYRGFIVRPIKTDEGVWSQAVPLGSPLLDEFRVGHKPTSGASAAELLLQTAERPHKYSHVTDELREVVAGGVALVESSAVADPGSFTIPTIEEGDFPTMTGDPRRFPTITGDDPHSPGGGPAAGEVSALGATWWACGSNYFSANAAFF